MRSHKDLDVWKRAMDIVDSIYSITKQFPREEIYGLTSQMRRCAVSVPSNIAEGSARNHPKDYIQFLYTSLGSLSELETQIIIAQRQKYISDIDSILNELTITRKQIIGLIKSVTRHPSLSLPLPTSRIVITLNL